MVRKLWLILSLACCTSGFSAVRILTFHYNQPEFIEMQYLTLKKFLTDDFELIVFNDAKTEENEVAIQAACDQYGIQCVRFEQAWHWTDPLNDYLYDCLQLPTTKAYGVWNATTPKEVIAQHPSVRHCHAIQYALDHYGYHHDDIVVLMDGDNFLIKPLSIRELLGDKDIIGFDQFPDEKGALRKKGICVSQRKGHEYLWVVFIAFDPNRLPNPHELKFHCDLVEGQHGISNDIIIDTGAAHYRYRDKYPELKIEAYVNVDSNNFRTYFSFWDMMEMGLSTSLIQLINDISPGNVQLFYKEHFMHFGSVSFELDAHQHKVGNVKAFINDILENE